MQNIQQIKAYARELNLTSLAVQIETLLEEALSQEPSYNEFSLNLLEREISGRRAANLARRIRTARLFRTMDQLTRTIKMKDVTSLAARDYKRLLKTDLLVIDDIMMFPLDKETAVGLFQLINQLHESTSFIITTNKNPKEWAEMLEDEVIATALLDRLLYKCEILRLSGKSYRLENRKTIFNDVVQSS